MSIVVSIHQPYFLPWLGVFEKISQADVFIILDDVEYDKNGFYNRNRIRSKDGALWLTVPTERGDSKFLKDVRISKASQWQKKHLKSIYYNYNRSKYIESYTKFLETMYVNSSWTNLVQLNIFAIEFFMKEFDIHTDTILSSSLDVSGKSTERLVNLCKRVDGNIYISGQSGKNYLQTSVFSENNIKLLFQDFKHPIYKQVYPDFIKNLSSLDFLLNVGPASSNIFK